MTTCPRASRLRLLAVIVGAVVLGACGAGSSQRGGGSSAGAGGDAGRLVAASADATGAARSARMSMTMDLAVDGRAGSFTADGAFDFSGRSGTLRMDLSSMGLPGVRGAIDVRLVDGVLYMDMGSLVADASPAEREALGGKRWVKLDLSQLGGAAGANGFGGLGSSDPTSALDSLRGAGSDVHEVGHETLRGVDTTHYRAQIDLSKALDEVPPSQRARVSKSLQALGTGTVPADVWIDGQGRVRKLAMDLNASVGRQHVGTITMELFDFGTPVDVQAPPADQTFDLQSLLGGAVGGMLGSRSSGVVSS